MKKDKSLSAKHVYKVDIHDYFNSVDTGLLFPILDKILKNDVIIINFIKSILIKPEVVYKDCIIDEPVKGIMAGIPLSAFLANLYLGEMDWRYYAKDILYLRYSDDIIVFQDSEETLQRDVEWLKSYLGQMRLTINPKKEKWAQPGEEWTFLGIKYRAGLFDISDQ